MESFLGYRRAGGRVGIRNHVVVISAVSCANTVVQHIERAVPGVVAVTHEHGCSQVGADLQQTADTLAGTGLNPNVFAVLVVSLGCEGLPSADVASLIAASGKPTELITIQELGGTSNAVDAGKKIVRRFLRQARTAQREECSMSDLIVALQCGGSDGWSGITANPAVGKASDLVVAAGGTAMIAETSEFVGAEHLMDRPGASPQAVAQLNAAIASFEAEVRRLGVDPRGAQPTPGNMAGGLTTIEEKALGAMMKCGSKPLMEFVWYAQRPSKRGLVIMDSPGNDVTSMAGEVAGGAQLVVFTTGRGSPAGHPVAPVIKVATNTLMYNHLTENMDINAGTILSDGETLESVGRRIYEEILAVANGKQTKAETLGHHEFGIWRIGMTF